MIKVILISKDGQKFEFCSREKSRDTAIEKAYDRLDELNYDSYGYQLHSVDEKDLDEY